MATSNATLGVFKPVDASGSGGDVQQASVVRKGSLGFLRFDGDSAQWVEFNTVLNRSATLGYSATTGVKVNIHWVSNDLKTTGAVKWVAQLVIVGATDKPNPATDLWSATYEATTTTTVNSTAGGANITVINVTIANIQGAQTTAPAAGDYLRVRVRREAADAADTLTGDALVYMVELQDY